MIPFQVRPGPLYRPSPIIRDERYKAFVRQFPCIGCKTVRRSREAMHIGPRGLSQRTTDLDCLPGCRKCHRTGPFALHKIGPAKFQEHFVIEFASLQRMFRRFYRIKHGTPDWWPDQPALSLYTCACGFEGFAEEFQFTGRCIECGREYLPERAA